MIVLVTGGTGFIGRFVVKQLLLSGHNVIVITRNVDRASGLPWFNDVKFIELDLQRQCINWTEVIKPDVLLHLAWPGLPNYKDFFHIGKNLPSDIQFLESAVNAGVKRIIVAGTCLEYGMQSGPLSEESVTLPITAYGFAKDALRKSLEYLQIEREFTLQWVRLFYMYGQGQNPNSLFSQLDATLKQGGNRFLMSNGDQLRDYLPVTAVANCFDWLVNHPEVLGVINCSSGRPISVIDIVNQHLALVNGKLEIVRGHYPYPDYEPMAFWGVSKKIDISQFLSTGI